MSEPILLALVTVCGAILGALIAQFAAMRRAPAQARLDDANADKAQHESAAIVNKDLREEIDRLNSKVTALEVRIVESERRATSAETRLADAEYRANESRRVVIVLGEKLDRERVENKISTEKLCILIEHLLKCIEAPSTANEIDHAGIAAMLHNIRSWAD